MYMFLQHSCYSVHTHSINLNAPTVPSQMQPATSRNVGPDVREIMVSTSEEHSVTDLIANVVRDLVIKHATTSFSIQ